MTAAADGLLPYPIVDGHLDIAGNVLGGRDYTLTAEQLRRREKVTGKQCMVTFPEMRRGGVAIGFATIFTGPNGYDGESPIYAPPADEQGISQVEVYLGWEAQGIVRIIRDRASLDAHLEAWQQDRKPALMIIMEGGDPINDAADLQRWWDLGVRSVGLAWNRTRYSGGSWFPGGLTPAGRELVAAMRERGMILDISHLAEQAFWDCIDVGPGPIAASHSCCRALNDSERQITDDMIRAIGERDGIVGMCLANGMLDDRWRDEAPVPVHIDQQVKAHAAHIAGLVGWDHVAFGSDFDGGLGLEETPLELQTEADLRLLADVVPPGAAEGFMGGNWIRFLRNVLP
jgi:membrane dipeptidase